MSEHTPGPWAFEEVPTSCGRAFKINEPALIGDGHGLIACIYDDRTTLNNRLHTEHEANAHLITAAPDLFAACKEFVRKVECGEARSKRSYAEMKAAIAKAEDAPLQQHTEEEIKQAMENADVRKHLSLPAEGDEA